MSSLDHYWSLPCYLEAGPDFVRGLKGEVAFELELHRQPDGQLDEKSKKELSARLTELLQVKAWEPRPRIICAIPARGVSLRRLKLPASGREELKRVLTLQIESEFPLPPEELAWGWQTAHLHSNGEKIHEVLVAAARKDALADLRELFTAVGASHVFTVAALARSWLCPAGQADYAVLELGNGQSELLVVKNGLAESVRVLPWGASELSRQGVEARPLAVGVPGFVTTETAPGPLGLGGSGIDGRLGTAVENLARAMGPGWQSPKLFLSGTLPASEEFDRALQIRLGTMCARLFPSGSHKPRSAALEGMKAAVAKSGGYPPLLLQAGETNGTARLVKPAPLKWAALLLVLAIAAMGVPWLEALLLKPSLERKLAAIQKDKGRLEVIDRELGFLRYLKDNQAPYLDALYILSKSTPPGSKLDSISMNRRGDISLRGSMRNGQEVVDFRSKLLSSGFFSAISVEEQTPTPDRQKVNIRISGQWKPASARQGLAMLAPAEVEKDKSPPGSRFSGMPPGMPGGMPPGMPQAMPGGVSPGMPVTVPAGVSPEMPPGARPPGVQPGGGPPPPDPGMPPRRRPAQPVPKTP